MTEEMHVALGEETLPLEPVGNTGGVIEPFSDETVADVEALEPADEVEEPQEGEEEYVEFHRKYQPRVWGDFVGQEEIIAQLKEDIIKNRRVQGRLLRGKPGVGKSSIVKVFTKAMNCTGRPADSADPCLTCDACLAFDASANGGMNHFVAALKSGVEDTRRIVSNGSVKQMQKAPFIIIDECHALSEPAWNAFLPYLENKDSADYVPIFFCTTKMNGIKDEIITRVQEYRLKNIPVATLEKYVRDIAAREHKEISDSGAAWCARAAKGSARGALKKLEEYLRNPDMYSGTESTATSLLRCLIYGDIIRIHEALEDAKEHEASLRDGTEEVMSQLRHYITWVYGATVSNADLPFADLPKQDIGLQEMRRHLPPDMAMKLLKTLERSFQGFWNTSDENIIFEILWIDVTMRMRSVITAKQSQAKAPQGG